MPNTIIRIIEGQVKDELLNRVMLYISNGVSNGVKYAEKSILASIRSNIGYEISLWGDDRKKMYKILKRIDPRQYKKYAIQERDEDTDDIFAPLRNNISYIIQMNKIRTYILVSTRCWDKDVSSYASSDEIHVFIFGVRAADVNELFLSVLQPAQIERKASNVDRRTLVNVYSIELNSEKTKAYLDSVGVSKTKRLNQLFTDKQQIDTLINYLNRWKDAASFFQKQGLTHKAGILLYGPPGTGKTTLATSLAAHFGWNLITLNIGEFSAPIVKRVNELSGSTPYVLLLEDIDYIFGHREDAVTTEEKSNANLLLQFLDGTKSTANLITIATTNYYEALDPAIIRDGRFDLKIHMDNIGRETAEEMIKSLNVTSVPFTLEDDQFPINPSNLQNQIIKHVFKNINSVVTDLNENEDAEENEEGFNYL